VVCVVGFLERVSCGISSSLESSMVAKAVMVLVHSEVCIVSSFFEQRCEWRVVYARMSVD
jgi:hypothetical protein